MAQMPLRARTGPPLFSPILRGRARADAHAMFDLSPSTPATAEGIGYRGRPEVFLLHLPCPSRRAPQAFCGRLRYYSYRPQAEMPPGDEE